ncbi:MAG: hypothetical protein LBJ88_06770 [Campylobacteraceae bacterium]|jgi:hypothetical protein|nr:hypothetical protein [Campylobacteraceae bacterium]
MLEYKIFTKGLKIKKIFFICMLVFNGWILADSPLTSTDIHLGYEYDNDIKKALKEGNLTDEWKDYLISSENYFGIKIAVINAIGYENINSKEFFTYLLKKEGYKSFNDFLDNADGQMLIIAAYLIALENYSNDKILIKALNIAKKGKKKLPKSYTANIIYALIKAQKELKGDWCEVYRVVDNVRNDKSLEQDMSGGAISMISYDVKLYADSCHVD